MPITNLDLPTDPLEFVRLALAGKLTIVDLLDNLPIYDAGASWLPWRSFLCALYGLPMTPDEQRIYTECTGRKIPPTKKAREAWIIAGRRARKALAIDTPIPTPTGWTAMGDLQVGDMVFDENGQPTRIVAATNVMHDRPCYELTFSDGEKITADAGHLWRIFGRADRRTTRPRAPESRLLETCEIAKAPLSRWAKGSKYSVTVNGALETSEAKLPVDPYVLGAWLGDGHSKTNRITTADPEILEYIRAAGETVDAPYNNGSKATTWKIGRIRKGERRETGLSSRLRELGVLGNKHIPAVYLRASIGQRLALLQGLMDTDGSCNRRGQPSFWNTNKELSEQVLELARSLSFKATLTQKRATLYGKDCGLCYCVRLSTRGSVGLPPFRLPRKLERTDLGGSPHLRWKQIRSCVPVPSVPVRCIQVDNPRGMFLAGRAFTPTHNSAISALIIVWESALRDHRLSKAPFERARALIMSETLTRGRQVFNYARAILEHTALRCLLSGEPNTERIPLWNEVDIELAPCRAMEGRSRTTVIAAFDEIAFFQTDDEYANPDSVIYESVRPSMMLVQQPLVLAFSSPYSRKGLLWANYQKHYGREDSDILVWQADSLFMHPHPMVKQEMERAYLDDPASAAAEFGAQFRTDIEEFVSLDLLRTITSKRGVLEIERDAEGARLYPKRPYYAFVDPSGGGADQFTLAISSYDSDLQRAILNGVWAWNPPFNVESVTEAVAAVLKRFSITQVKGDHYGGRYPRDLFSRHGITYTPSDLDRSSIYLEVLPLLRSGRVDLPESLKGCEFNLVDGVPHATKVDLAHRMRQQFTQLERKKTGKGKEIVDHPRGKKDDVVNSACGALLMAGVRGKRVIQKQEAAASWTPAQRWRDMTKPGQYVTPARAASNPYARGSGSPSPLGPSGSRKVY